MFDNPNRNDDLNPAPRERYPEATVIERRPITRSTGDVHFEPTPADDTPDLPHTRGRIVLSHPCRPRRPGRVRCRHRARSTHHGRRIRGARTGKGRKKAAPTACTVLLIMGLLGLGLALSQFNAATAATQGALPASFGRNVGFWTLFSLLIAFVVGGYVAVRAEHVRVPEHAAWRGAQVFLLASPLLVLLLVGGSGPLKSAPLRAVAGLHVDRLRRRA